MPDLLDTHPIMLFLGIVVIFLIVIVMVVTMISRLYRD